ncbi:MAG: DNA topoisomerase [Hymenobacter sp.]
MGDWLLGLNATRLFTLKYTTYQDKQLLSIGRVQTPTLALLVDRLPRNQELPARAVLGA